MKNHQQTRLSYSEANDASSETFTKDIPLFENIDPSNQSPNLSNNLKCNPEQVNCPDRYSEKTSSNNVFNDETESIPISDKLFIDLGTKVTSPNTAGEETQWHHDHAENLDSNSNQVPPAKRKFIGGILGNIGLNKRALSPAKKRCTEFTEML